jgi:NADPH:quinone reductase-like Zn-dependent oxidoreductase
LLQAVLLGPLVRMVGGKSLRVLAFKPNQDLSLIASLCAEGKLKPVIDETTWGLEQAPEAMQYYAAARQKGKVVVTVSPER